MAKDIQPLSQFETVQTRLVPFRKAKELQACTSRVLVPIRNQVAFHFDPKLVPAILDSLKHPNYVFASHTFGNNLHRYHQLADFALIPAAFTEGESPSFLANYQKYLANIMRYAKEYCEIIDQVLTEVAQALAAQRQSR